jgi:fatty-acid desaturase
MWGIFLESKNVKKTNEIEFLVSTPSIDPDRSLEVGAHQFPSLREFKVRWPVAITHFLVHGGAVVAFWFVTPVALITCGILYFLTMLGITVGYHRLLAHRSYECHAIVKWFHIAFASISLQLGPITWARMHRAHHARSDTIEDPHTQIFGFWFGHIGWVLLAHPQIGRSSLWKKNPPDLMKDATLRFFEKFNFPLFLASLLILYYFGGLPMLLWAGCVRVVLTSHFVWFVNSLCHRFGSRRFSTSDWSLNNAFVAVFTLGEGWHNNHHRFQSSAKQGLFWYEPDISWLWLRFLQKIGLVWDLKTPAIYAPTPNSPEFPYEIAEAVHE